jgi:hypothetical protein
MDHPTLSTVTESRPMAFSEPVLPETRERQCPRCGSQQIVHAGQVIAFSGMIKAAQQCEVCGTAFWFLRMRMPCRVLDLDARGRTLPLVAMPSRR